MSKKILSKMMAVIAGAMLVFSLTACDNGTTGSDSAPKSVTYASEDSDGNRYTLVITENTKRSAQYLAKDGDFFKLTVELYNDGDYTVALSYEGRIGSTTEKNATEIEISISVNNKPLTITITGTEMTLISGIIVLDNEEEITITEPLKPKEENMGNPYLGESMRFTGQVWTGEPNYIRFNGNLSVVSSSNNDIACSGSITNGRLALTVGTPVPDKPLTSFFESTVTNWWKEYLYSNDAKCAAWHGGEIVESGFSWLQRRRQSDAVFTHEEVRYVYVDKDVIVTAKGQVTVDDGFAVTSSDISLSLRKGWNAVYFKLADTSSTTATVTYLLGNPDHLYWLIY
jgi:hypothetical protein